MCLSPKLEERAQDLIMDATTTMDLANIPRELSLSSFLSPSGLELDTGEVPTVLTLRGKSLDTTHLVLLALNEECRCTGRGAFYHLPLRTEQSEAHPCDLIYLPDGWNAYDMSSWDKASWAERLEMCTISRSRLLQRLCCNS